MSSFQQQNHPLRYGLLNSLFKSVRSIQTHCTCLIIHKKRARARAITNLYNPNDRLISCTYSPSILLSTQRSSSPSFLLNRLSAQTGKLHELKEQKIKEMNLKDTGLLHTPGHLAYVSKIGTLNAHVFLTANICWIN